MNLSTMAPVAGLCIVLAACAPQPAREAPTEATAVDRILTSTHRDADDLLTAGLEAAGLRSAVAPAFADPARPTAAELRRRAIWNNWRGIADLAPGGGYGEVYGTLTPVPGREYHALRTLPGASQPHRVMVQLPDAFDPAARCVLVSASSGSRGIYGAIALAGAWGLPRGCAVAYTDKGAGTDYFDVDSGSGVALDGTRAQGPELAFAPPTAGAGGSRVLIKHAHSGDNPEAQWGGHVKQAAQFALQVLNAAYPLQAPFTFANTRVIAVGVSNGGGAVLRAAEDVEPWLDGAVAISPNVYAEGGRALFDYGTEAALLAPCALSDPAFAAAPFAGTGTLLPALSVARCASLHAHGLLHATSPTAQAQEALAQLRARGWSDAALHAAVLSSAFDLWRTVASAYAAAYARSGSAPMPCGFAFAVPDAQAQPRAASDVERAAWWSDASGIPPGAGVALLDGLARDDADPAFAGLHCLRKSWDGDGAWAARVIEGVTATRAVPPRAGLPVLVIHGLDDGLIPAGFSSAPYVQQARAVGRDLRYWQVEHAQHFDAFLGFPAMAARYQPLLPYAYRGLDRLWAHLREGAPMPADARIVPRQRDGTASGVVPLQLGDLALPQ